MNAVKHDIVHQYQPTPSSCSQTSLAILLSHYGITMTPEAVLEAVPQTKNEKGEDAGSINQQLATWCVDQGFKVSFYTFDCQIIDQAWAGWSKDKIAQALEEAKDGWEVPSLGRQWSNAYRQAYIEYLNTDGELHIQPFVTSQLLYRLLETGPIIPAVCFNTLYASGRTDPKGEYDSINGTSTNHTIVVYGFDDNGNYLVADPLRKPGLHVIKPERLLAAISTAQTECDNLFFQINK